MLDGRILEGRLGRGRVGPSCWMCRRSTFGRGWGGSCSLCSAVCETIEHTDDLRLELICAVGDLVVAGRRCRERLLSSIHAGVRVAEQQPMRPEIAYLQ